jgi:hypothetical protein
VFVLLLSGGIPGISGDAFAKIDTTQVVLTENLYQDSLNLVERAHGPSDHTDLPCAASHPPPSPAGFPGRRLPDRQ